MDHYLELNYLNQLFYDYYDITSENPVKYEWYGGGEEDTFGNTSFWLPTDDPTWWNAAKPWISLEQDTDGNYIDISDFLTESYDNIKNKEIYVLKTVTQGNTIKSPFLEKYILPCGCSNNEGDYVEANCISPYIWNSGALCSGVIEAGRVTHAPGSVDMGEVMGGTT